MATQYTLTVINNSSNFEQFAVYQNDPDLGSVNDLNLAWLVNSGDPGAKVPFNWNAPSEPGATNVFTPHPEYWLTAGTFEPGQVVDPAQMANAVPVVFPPDVYAMEATLNPDNTWTVG